MCTPDCDLFSTHHHSSPSLVVLYYLHALIFTLVNHQRCSSPSSLSSLPPRSSSPLPYTKSTHTPSSSPTSEWPMLPSRPDRRPTRLLLCASVRTIPTRVTAATVRRPDIRLSSVRLLTYRFSFRLIPAAERQCCQCASAPFAVACDS